MPDSNWNVKLLLLKLYQHSKMWEAGAKTHACLTYKLLIKAAVAIVYIQCEKSVPASLKFYPLAPCKVRLNENKEEISEPKEGTGESSDFLFIFAFRVCLNQCLYFAWAQCDMMYSLAISQKLWSCCCLHSPVILSKLVETMQFFYYTLLMLK